MAAAVADRHNVAVRLLSAAGSAVGVLVSHANRYGQTAVHIAARKGSLPLLTALLAIGGPAIASVSSPSYLMSCILFMSDYYHGCLSCQHTCAVCWCMLWMVFPVSRGGVYCGRHDSHLCWLRMLKR